jgi:hypothetical protein
MNHLSLRLLLAGLAAAAVTGCLATPPASAMCMPVCTDCDLRSGGQTNWLILDPDGRHVGMIPNVRLEGSAADFGLIVPTPSVPDLVPVSVSVWDESFQLTAPLVVRGDSPSGDALGCNADRVAPLVVAPDDVNILVSETVGEFDVVILQAGDSQALVDWFNQNGFTYDSGDAARFAPYVEAGWVFTAMHLSEGAQVPTRWDTNVDPVLFTFETDAVRIPLPLLAMRRTDVFPMAFFVVSDHRMDLPGFNTAYANRLSASETEAIRDRYPTLGSFLTAGRFVTRLDRTFQVDDPMDTDLELVRAADDSEFRRTTNTFWGFPDWAAALFGVYWIVWRLQSRRRRARIT